MLVNSIGFKPFCNPQQTRNINFNGKIGFIYADPALRDEFVPKKVSNHEQNIIDVMGKDAYDALCDKVDEQEKMTLAHLLNRLDDDSVIIIAGNSDQKRVAADFEDFIEKEPNVNKNINRAYLMQNKDYEYPVFITTSKQTGVHGDPMFMIHSKGKLRIQSPWWSPAQVRTVKNTRYLTYGDVVRVDLDGHHIKLEKPKSQTEIPKGISEKSIDNLI